MKCVFLVPPKFSDKSDADVTYQTVPPNQIKYDKVYRTGSHVLQKYFGFSMVFLVLPWGKKPR